MELQKKLEQQAKELEQENYHTAAQTMREAIKTLNDYELRIKTLAMRVIKLAL